MDKNEFQEDLSRVAWAIVKEIDDAGKSVPFPKDKLLFLAETVAAIIEALGFLHQRIMELVDENRNDNHRYG